MSHSDAWDDRDRAREAGLRRLHDAFDAAKWFILGAFTGVAGMLLLAW